MESIGYLACALALIAAAVELMLIRKQVTNSGTLFLWLTGFIIIICLISALINDFTAPPEVSPNNYKVKCQAMTKRAIDKTKLNHKYAQSVYYSFAKEFERECNSMESIR